MAPVIALALLGGLFLVAKSQSSPGQISAQYFAQVKGAINTAVSADVARGAPALGDAQLNQMTMAWIRGDATELGGIAGGLRATHPFTAQAFGSRYQQVTGRPWIPPAIAAPVAAAPAPKAA